VSVPTSWSTGRAASREPGAGVQRGRLYRPVHATTLDGTREVGLLQDDPVVPASVIKVLVALEAETALADGVAPRPRSYWRRWKR
jgi:hypothetical protein